MKGESFFYRSVSWLLGFISVRRDRSLTQTDMIASEVSSRDVCRLFISPEGTRKKTDRLKTGFYYIAVKAGVPVVFASINTVTREYFIGPVIDTTVTDLEETIKIGGEWYDKMGFERFSYYPERVTPFVYKPKIE